MKKLVWVAFIGMASFYSPGGAQESTPTPQTTPRPKISIGLLVDGYYSYNATNAAVSALGSGNRNYLNDTDSMDTLALAELSFDLTQGETGIHVSAIYGQEVDTMLNRGLIFFGGIPYNQFAIWEAYGSYHPGNWIFQYGKFASFLGFEVLQSDQDWNYSRSLMFTSLPYRLTGFNAGYTSPDGLWDVTGYLDGSILYDFGPGSIARSYGLKLRYRPSGHVSFTLNGLTGPFGTADNIFNQYYLEGIVQWKVMPKFSLALDGTLNDTFSLSNLDPPWRTLWGAALYGRYEIDPDWDVALRLEETQNLTPSFTTPPPPVTLGAYNTETREVTLTLGHHFTEHILVRIEGRYDYALSNGQTWAPGSGPYAGGSDDQYTGTASVVISF